MRLLTALRNGWPRWGSGRRHNRSLDEYVEELLGDALERGFSSEQIQRAIDEASRESAAVVAAELRGALRRMIREHGGDRRRFERNLAHRWGAALDLFYAVYVGCLEVGEEYADTHRPEAVRTNDYRFEALVRLHARACLVASEVHALLRTGHARGAEARARTLHETAVVAYVLKDGTAADAERYLLHARAQDWKRAQTFQPLAKRLGEEPFTDEEMQEMWTGLAELRNRFGPGFTKDYGWAGPIVGKKHPRFSDLEKHVALDHLRPYYQWFSESVHAGAKSAESVLVERGPHRFLLSGPSNDGLADPAQLAMGSLYQVTTTLVLDEPSFETLVMVLSIDELRSAAAEAFAEAHRRLNEDEAAIEWDDERDRVTRLREATSRYARSLFSR